MKVFSRNTSIYGALAMALAASPAAWSTDWLSIQGTEPAGAAERAKIWGFIQPQYSQTDGTKIKDGPWKNQDAIFNVIRPDNDTESTFHLRRARLGVRGTGFPIDSNVNYFLLAELGNNGITDSGGGSVKVTDASVTLNHLKDYTRVRIGQFKTPGSEDGLQAIHVHNYNEFSLVADQLLLERFRDWDGEANCLVPQSSWQSGAGPTLEQQAWFLACADGNGLNGSVGAYRDIGVQLFNTFTIKDGPGAYPWELSYAFMVGNGNGIARGDNDDNREYYYYLSAGQVFGGNGPRRDDWKVFAWYQDGKRTLLQTANDPNHPDSGAQPPFYQPDFGSFAVREFDRDRWGIGGTFRKDRFRLYGEYIWADGMIPNGSDGGAVGGAVSNNGQAIATFNTLPDNKADGWYLDFGYKVLPNLELDVRYDQLDRGTEGDPSLQRDFERWTLGAQYFFNKKSRFTLNYEFRDIEAPGGNATQKNVVDSIDDMLTAQVLIIF